MESGWDPEVKRFLRKILNTVSIGLLWMMAMVFAGLYFELGIPGDKPVAYNIIFYVLALATLAMLLRYYYKLWNDK